jgi:hypothetical protein
MPTETPEYIQQLVLLIRRIAREEALKALAEAEQDHVTALRQPVDIPSPSGPESTP